MSYVALATVTLSSATSSVTFGSIPATFKDLVVIVSGTQAAISASIIAFNGNTTASNYSRVWMLGDGSGTASNASSADRLIFNLGSTQSSAIVQIMDYSATDKHKTYLSRSNAPGNYLYALAGRFANTSAITSVSFTGDPSSFVAGTTFSLYGIA